MLKIRLKRVGRRNDPSYRVVVTEATASPKSGRSVEVLGSYNPKNNQKSIDAERASYWISVGAQPSGTVHNLLVDAGVVKDKKINVLPKKSPIKKEVTEKESAPAPQSESDEQKSSEEEVPAETSAEEVPTAENQAPREETYAEGEGESPKVESPEEEKPEEESAT